MNPNPCERTRFKKGRSGNPGGLKKGEIAKRALKFLTQAEITNIYRRLMNYSPTELTKFLKLKTTPIIEQIVARALLSDIEHGELLNTDKILNRIIGKIPELHEFGKNDTVPFVPPVIQFVSV